MQAQEHVRVAGTLVHVMHPQARVTGKIVQVMRLMVETGQVRESFFELS